MAADGLLFNNIVLGGRLRINPGKMRVNLVGIEWKRQGGKEIRVHKSDIVVLTWMKVPKSYQLGVQTKDGQLHKFTGFHDQDVSNLTKFLQDTFGMTPEVKEMSVSGHNWGDVSMSGNMLSFLVGSKHAFDICLTDVSQAQLQGKEDVLFEFQTDDTIGADEKDSLMELSFHIPTSNTQYAGDEARPPAQVFHEKVVSIADVGASGEAAVVTFEGIKILTPRAKYDVDLHRSFLHLQGQSNDFKIKYRSIVRLFLLPKDPHTFLVISLDPPIRKGQTLYPHVLLQFDNDSVIDKRLSMSEDLLTKYKLEASYKGFIHEVFTAILRRLSGVRVTRPDNFRSREKGYAVKSSLKTDDGVLYPLGKEFLFLPKPTLVLNDEIAYVEFESHGAGGASMQYFDLVLKLKTEQEYVFQNIQKREYTNLATFISEKGLKIMNYGEAQNSNGVMNAVRNGHDDTVDPHFERIRDEADDDSDDDDGDFVMAKDEDDGGSPTDESGEDDAPSASESEAEVKNTKKEPKIEEAFASKMSISRKTTKGEGGSKVVKKEARIDEEFTSKLFISRKRSNNEVESKKRKDNDVSKKRKPKKKKDPNAPKRALSDFMFFSQMERANIKQRNPGMGITDVSKALGEKWRNMTVEEKEPFKKMARADQERYKDAMAGYKGDPMGVDS